MPEATDPSIRHVGRLSSEVKRGFLLTLRDALLSGSPDTFSLRSFGSVSTRLGAGSASSSHFLDMDGCEARGSDEVDSGDSLLLHHSGSPSPEAPPRAAQPIPPERPGKPMLRLRLLDGDHLSLHREDDPTTVAEGFCDRRGMLDKPACSQLVHYMRQAFSPVARKMVSGVPAKPQPSPKWVEPPEVSSANPPCGCGAPIEADDVRESMAPKRGDGPRHRQRLDRMVGRWALNDTDAAPPEMQPGKPRARIDRFNYGGVVNEIHDFQDGHFKMCLGCEHQAKHDQNLGKREKDAEIGLARQVFADDWLVSGVCNVERRLGDAHKHPEPVLVQDKPWESSYFGFYGNVLREGNLFKMWYMAFSRGTGYAESKDGVRWFKPVMDVLGSRGKTFMHLASSSRFAYTPHTIGPGSNILGAFGNGFTTVREVHGGAVRYNTGYMCPSMRAKLLEWALDAGLEPDVEKSYISKWEA